MLTLDSRDTCGNTLAKKIEEEILKNLDSKYQKFRIQYFKRKEWKRKTKISLFYIDI